MLMSLPSFMPGTIAELSTLGDPLRRLPACGIGAQRGELFGSLLNFFETVVEAVQHVPGGRRNQKYVRVGNSPAAGVHGDELGGESFA